MSRVLDAIAAHARRTPHVPAVAGGNVTLTWHALQLAVETTARDLARALEAASPEAPVAIAVDNGPPWVVVDLALMRLGRPSVPLPGFFSEAQRRHVLADCGAALLIAPASNIVGGVPLDVAGESLAMLRLGPAKASPLHPGTAKITYTSGSTGTPKGVCLSLLQMEAVAASVVEVLGARFARTHLAILPLGVLLENIAGLYPTLIAGGRYEAHPLASLGFENPFRPDFARMAQEARRLQATSLILTPELLRGLMAAHAADRGGPGALELVAVGGAKLAPGLIGAARAMGIPAYEGYGLSECASVVALNTPHADAPGSVGRVLPHLELSLADDGEIIVGPAPYLGYLGGPAHLGPVFTGDLGSIDAEGRLHIIGRKKNILITAFGRNVAPEWVESELLAEQAIAQAAVFGEAARGLCALLVPTPAGASPGSLAAAVERANQRLPAYARVERWVARPPFDPAKGEATTNGRPRRDVLAQAHKDFIEMTGQGETVELL